MASSTMIRTLSEGRRKRDERERDYSFAWQKGPARYEDGAVVMRVDAYGANTSPRIADGVEIELSRVHTPEQAAVFVGRFGLLEHGVYWPKSNYVNGDPLVADEDVPVEDHEPYELFDRCAADIRNILATVKNVREAAAGDAAALASLQEWARHTWRDDDLGDELNAALIDRSISAPDFLARITRTVAGMLTAGLQSSTKPAQMWIGGPALGGDWREAPDRLTPAVYIPTLRAFAYWSLAQKLASRAPILTCPGCQHDFVLEHKRQQFCTRTCTRHTRYLESKTAAGDKGEVK